jgi:hypothetical protein
MNEVFICTACYQTYGEDNGADYCNICESYKYFAWVEAGTDNEDF